MHKTVISWLFVLFVLTTPLMAANALGGVHEDHPYSFLISKDIYKTAEVYQIHSELKETYPGSVKKSAFRIRTNYDLSNKEGWQATGITRVISLGTLYPWATDIDIYDTRGVQIGLIDGNLATSEKAKFNLYDYDEAGNSAQIGIAYASADFNRFTIVSSTWDPHPIAEMNRDFSNNTWSVTVHYPDTIDDRMIRIFAGFVVNYQDKFLEKNPEE